MVFTGNTAGISGSGIHATDIGKCIFTGLSREAMQDDATLFERSIFYENKGKFDFRYLIINFGASYVRDML